MVYVPSTQQISGAINLLNLLKLTDLTELIGLPKFTELTRLPGLTKLAGHTGLTKLTGPIPLFYHVKVSANTLTLYYYCLPDDSLRHFLLH